MKIKTFFWNERKKNIFSYFLRRITKKRNYSLLHGNSGDIFVRNIISSFYNCSYIIKNEGPRLLLVGSIPQYIKDGDLISGIGVRSKEKINSEISRNIFVHGLRGPISYDVLKKSGFNLDNLRFLFDPGLLIKEIINESTYQACPRDISFIPHYRERFEAKKSLPRGIRFLNIDCCPIKLGQKILNSKLVYSSSLHGLIFAHALGRPAIFVQPQTKEPLEKFEDYYLSIGASFPKPLYGISDADFLRDSDTPLTIPANISSDALPSIGLLRRHGVVA